MTMRDPEAQWFGFQPVSPQEKTRRVQDVFASVATNYDLMNDLMSAGMHRLWKDIFVGMMAPKPYERIVDVAGGTGDITRRCLRRTKGLATITVCDPAEDMMRVGERKTLDEGWLNNVSWVKGYAESLPLPDKSVDLACISFGLRNVTQIDTALDAFYRVLDTGGRFFCMEFSPSVAPPLKKLYDLYSFSVLPWLGEQVAKDKDSYTYLAESIRQFPDPTTLAARMENAGFEQVRWRRLTGGIVAIHSGWKL